jgi:hypothetical protein
VPKALPVRGSEEARAEGDAHGPTLQRDRRAGSRDSPKLKTTAPSLLGTGRVADSVVDRHARGGDDCHLATGLRPGPAGLRLSTEVSIVTWGLLGVVGQDHGRRDLASDWRVLALQVRDGTARHGAVGKRFVNACDDVPDEVATCRRQSCSSPAAADEADGDRE